MYNENDLRNLAADYKDIKAPAQLKDKAGSILAKRPGRMIRRLKTAGLAAASLSIIFVGAANLSPAFAENIKGIPFLNSAAQLVTFRVYEETAEDSELSIDQPQIKGMTDEDLAGALNQKYADQAKTLYEEYLQKINGGIEHLTLVSGYAVKADNGTTVSIEHSIFTAQASGEQRYEYDTLDVKNQLYITLPSLFQDDSYLQRISDQIRQQMKERMSAHPEQTYFLDESGFTGIDPKQQFYIDENQQLVIVFDEYAVAPGSMGAQEFTIPGSVIADLLIDNTYIK